jgi:hypothetical protein
VYSLYQASTTIARGCRSADDLEQRCRAALNVVEVTVLGVTKLNPHEDWVRPVALGQRTELNSAWKRAQVSSKAQHDCVPLPPSTFHEITDIHILSFAAEAGLLEEADAFDAG